MGIPSVTRIPKIARETECGFEWKEASAIGPSDLRPVGLQPLILLRHSALDRPRGVGEPRVGEGSVALVSGPEPGRVLDRQGGKAASKGGRHVPGTGELIGSRAPRLL